MDTWWQISSRAIRYDNMKQASATDFHWGVHSKRWEIFSGEPEATVTKARRCDLNRSGECSPYLRGSTPPNSPFLFPSQSSDVLSNQQLLQTTRLCSPTHKARWHALPWWSWMRGIVNPAAWRKKKKRILRVGRLVEESLIKERREVWLPPSGETKLFIRPGKILLSDNESFSRNIKHIRLWSQLDSAAALNFPFIRKCWQALKLWIPHGLFCSHEHKRRHFFSGPLGKKQH